MKQKFMNAVFTNLITEKDYLPFRDEEGAVVLRENILPLQKFHMGNFFIVELIDGDLLSDAELSQKFMKSGNFLDNADPNQVLHIIEIIIFDAAAPAAKMEIINTATVNKTFGKKYLTCLTLNISAREVMKNTGFNFADGIEKSLNRFLKSDLTDYEMVTDINRLVEDKEKKSTIRFKTDAPVITYILIAVNIAVWVFLSLYAKLKGVNYDDLTIIAGAKENYRIFTGEYWRFLTPVFLHGNWLHLLLNCYSLYSVGSIVERIFGRNRFLVIYFFAGILGNIISFVFSIYAGVGASGAIFGLIGALFYYGVENPLIFKKYFGYNLIAILMINIVYGFSTAGIDNSAHLGGLAGGFLAAGVVRLEGGFSISELLQHGRRRLLMLLLTIFVACGGLYYGFNNNRNLGYYHLNLGLDYYRKDQHKLANDELAKAIELSHGDRQLTELIKRITR